MLASLLIWLSSLALLHSAYSAWAGTVLPPPLAPSSRPAADPAPRSAPTARLAAKQAGTAVTLLLGSPVPREILVEALVSLFFLVIGVLSSSPKLKGATWASEMSKR
ncbi:hypothetical protein JCM21900_002195, partial [Sporobolomyces salmonicolor]